MPTALAAATASLPVASSEASSASSSSTSASDSARIWLSYAAIRLLSDLVCLVIAWAFSRSFQNDGSAASDSSSSIFRRLGSRSK